jgi:nicotinate dehydrogenase subunit A
MASAPIRFNLNGTSRVVDVEGDTPLLYVLRDNVGLHGPKFGCGLAQCGACTVLIDGSATRSCVFPMSAVGASKVVTLEGLGDEEHPSRVQRAFIQEQAAQCGYCTSGMITAATALLAKKPHPTDADITTALAGNLCRCGTHLRIVRAIHRAAGEAE